MALYLRMVGVILLAPVFFLVSALAQERVRFATDFKSPDNFLPVVAALEKGYFRDQGIEVDSSVFRGGRPTVQAIAARSVDMGTISYPPLLVGISRGVDAVAVADPGYGTGFGLWVLADSPLKKPQDLKGARLGTLELGGLTYIYAVALLKALGLEGQVKIVAAGGGPARVAALKVGATEATLGGVLEMAPLILRGEVRELVSLTDYLPRGVDGVVFFATRTLLEKKAGLVRKAVGGWLKGAGFVLENREWAVSKMQEEWPYSPEVASFVYGRLKYDKQGKIDPGKIKQIVKFLVDYGVLDKDNVPRLERIYVEGLAG